MPNYNLKFGVSEVANLLKVERNLIKSWAYKFSEYLNPEANPVKGVPRCFCTEDICVLAYVSYYWEDEPDIESIKYGINGKNHLTSPFSDLITTVTPLFTDLPEILDEGEFNGVVFGGISELADISMLADAYKHAGDILVHAAIENNEEFDLLGPIIFNYRHATELYLKSIIVKPPKSHDLVALFKEFKIILKSEFNNDPPQWFENIILAFNDFDPGGTNFRYGNNKQVDEIVVNLSHVKILMGWLSESFQKIRHSRI